MSQWIDESKKLPREGVVVETMSEGQLEQNLMLKGDVWYLANGIDCVYYTPIFWRPIQDE